MSNIQDIYKHNRFQNQTLSKNLSDHMVIFRGKIYTFYIFLHTKTKNFNETKNYG